MDLNAVQQCHDGSLARLRPTERVSEQRAPKPRYRGHLLRGEDWRRGREGPQLVHRRLRQLGVGSLRRGQGRALRQRPSHLFA